MCDDSGVRKGHKEHKQPNGQDLRVDDRLEAELHGCSWFPALIHIWFGIRSAHEREERSDQGDNGIAQYAVKVHLELKVGNQVKLLGVTLRRGGSGLMRQSVCANHAVILWTTHLCL